MLRWQRAVLLGFGLLAALLLWIGSTAAQGAAADLEITHIDTTEFPDIRLRLMAQDEDGRAVRVANGLRLWEGERPIPDPSPALVNVGVDVVFVIDANASIEDIDESGGRPRREKVRDAIIRFANRFMDPAQRDRVSIVVPDDSGGRFLDGSNLSFSSEVINAINFYETGELGPTPLDAMLTMAIEHLAQLPEEGRYRAVVLFSDSAQLDEQLDFLALTEAANAADVVLHGLILGTRVDAEEEANMTLLTLPTQGQQRHMPQPERADALFQIIQEFGAQIGVAYRSAVASSGQHLVRAELQGSEAEATFTVEVAAPAVRLAIDNSRPIRRVAGSADVPLEEIEPTVQPLVAQLNWPDNHPRRLESATLIVSGAEAPLQAPVLSDDGVLTFDWDISRLGQGTYPLQLQVTDELGLVGQSDTMPLEIVVEQPQTPQQATVAPTALPTAAPAARAVEEDPAQLLTVTVGVLILLLAAVLLTLAYVVISRRRADDEVVPAAAGPAPAPPPPSPAPAPPHAAAPPSGSDNPETIVMLPDPPSGQTVQAYLEVLQHAPEHQTKIPLVGNNIALGRDMNRVQVRFRDQSVSRLHARIISSQGGFRVYDEGSASGTYVNYERIGLTPRVLKDRDHLHLGRVHLRFRLVTSAAGSDVEPPDTEVYRLDG
ncbi:MAG: FHA domain-containing protein [Candidatus Promineifilaceae bacterium]|nr:FHA domain-containing protein [Candidatus Promineifilaceae bacterium]